MIASPVKDVHPGRPHRATLDTWDPRYKQCEVPKCDHIVKVKPVIPPAQMQSETSKKAAQRVSGEKAHAQRLAVLGLLRNAGPAHRNEPPFTTEPPVLGGLTAGEIAERLELTGDSVRPRIWQLVKDQLVRKAGHDPENPWTRRNSIGNLMTVYEAVDFFDSLRGTDK